MPLAVVVQSEARRELVEASDYLESQRPGYGFLFAEAIERELELLANFPRLGKRVKRAYAHSVIGWRYSIVYDIRGDTLVVVAIAHHRRRPEYWKDRL